MSRSDMHKDLEGGMEKSNDISTGRGHMSLPKNANPAKYTTSKARDVTVDTIFPLLYFPLVINEIHARAVGLLGLCICVVIIIFREKVVAHYCAAALAADFLARFAFGGRMSPIGITADLISRWFKPVWIDGAPKQFAAFCGLTFSTVAAGVFFSDVSGHNVGGAIVIGLLLCATMLEAVLNFCAGCWMWGLFLRMGLVSKGPGQQAAKVDQAAAFNYYTTITAHDPAEQLVYVHSGTERQDASLSYKVKSDEYTRDSFNPIKYCHVYYFLMPTGMAGWALIWVVASIGLGAEESIWKGFVYLAVTVFLILLFLYGAKIALYPLKVYKEFVHPVKSNFFALFPILLLLLSWLARDWKPRLCQLLFWVGAPLQMLLSTIFTARWIQTPYYIQHIDGSWLLVPVSGFLAAFVAPSVLGGPPDHSRPLAFQEAGWLWWSSAMLMWILLTAIVLLRVITENKPEDRHRSSILTFIAAPAMGGLAYMSLSDPFNFDDNFVRFLFYVSWAWFLVAALLAAQGFFRSARFTMDCWGFVFPLDLLAVISVLFHSSYRTRTSAVLCFTAFVAAGVATYMCTIHTIALLLDRRMFIPDDKWGPLSFMKLVHRAYQGALKRLETLTTELANFPNSVQLRAVEQLLNNLNVLHHEHSRHEDEIIYKAFDDIFPGVADFATADHHPADNNEGEAFAAVMAQLAVVKSAAVGEAQAEQAQVLVKRVASLVAELRQHMQSEEDHLNPVGRKHFPVRLMIDVTRQCFITTPGATWATLFPFIVESIELPGQRIRFLKCLRWACPERMEQFGRFLYTGLNDPFLFRRLATEVPEIVPRGVSGWFRYH